MRVDLQSLFPDGISDEAASVVSDFLRQIISDWDGHYFLQISRHHDRQRRLRCDPDQPWKTLPPDQ